MQTEMRKVSMHLSHQPGPSLMYALWIDTGMLRAEQWGSLGMGILYEKFPNPCHHELWLPPGPFYSAEHFKEMSSCILK